MFRIVRTDRVELEVQVPAADVPAARATAGVALEIPGMPEPFQLQPRTTSTTPASSIPRHARWPLQMEIANPGERLLVGQSGTAILYTRERSACRRYPPPPC